MPEAVVNSFQCETCRRKYAWKQELAGKRLRCKCGSAISVPLTVETARPIPTATPSPPMVRSVIEHAALEADSPIVQPQKIIAPGQPKVFLVMVIASVVVGVLCFWAGWINASEWGKAFRGSAPGNSNPWYPGDPQWMRALYFYSLASIGLAVCLIGAGVILLIRPLFGVKLHLWCALLKILFLLGEIVLCVYYLISVSDSGPAQNHVEIPAKTTRLIESVLLQGIYPIAILLVLFSSKRIKAYLALKREERRSNGRSDRSVSTLPA